jgi:uncharacterized membrane protein YqhA
MIKESMMTRHFLGFITMFVFVILENTTEKDPFIIARNSVGLYLFFVILMKNTMITLGISTFFITILLILDNYLKTNELGESTKKQIKEIKNMIRGVILVITSIGLLAYIGKKKLQYKKQFDLFTFIFGKDNCSTKWKSKHDFITMLSHAFD